jgi:hypothetical protein
VRIPGSDAPALRSWLHDVADVRPAVAALIESYDIAEALDRPATLDLRAMQLPISGDAWAGTAPAPAPGTLDVVAVRGFSGPTPDRLCGLVVDSWTQTVPAAEHRTALAFHFDEPDAGPAPDLLVAVAPDEHRDQAGATWDLDTLLAVVTSTLDLAADRAVAAELHPDAAITLPDDVR